MRLHLFEWMDQPWLPGMLRDAMRQYLNVAYRALPVCTEWATLVGGVLHAHRERRVIDLGSGAAGPVIRVAAEVRRHGTPVEVVATDLFPFKGEPGAGVTFYPEPVDARRVPVSLAGVRTMFAAFHHLRPADARAVLEDALSQRQAICVFEATARTPVAVGSTILIPFLVLLLTPQVRPLRASALIFTYLVPLLPVLLFWDGLVSHLRTYSREELNAFTRELTESDYQWTTGELHAPGIPFGLPYLIGQRAQCQEKAVATSRGVPRSAPTPDPTTAQSESADDPSAIV